jgi:pyruvate formate lyase activating enzyme
VCDLKAINADIEVKSGFKIDRNLCNNCGRCVAVCPKQALNFVGEKVSVDEVLQRVEKDKLFFLSSRGGITISGGEPLYQFEFVRELLRKSYEHNLDTTLETCGYAPFKNFEEILPYLNLILYDIKHMDPVKHKQATGGSNKLILSNLKKLSKSNVPIVIRLPLIPKFNTDEENIVQTATFVASLQNVCEVNLLPFHQLGKDKYFNLGKKYSLEHLKAMESDAEGILDISTIKSTFESFGLKTLVGG